ncbi:MAG TPA: hypothetical protein VMV79_01290 [Alphaproteobacteria bacterium]|nr:hypothetical protein [Alphaproteobacteria bacterium]
MFEAEYWKKYFAFQSDRVSVEPGERFYPTQEVRDWCELSITYLQFKQEQSSQPARYNAALERYRRDLEVLDALEGLNISNVSYQALYKITGARNLIDVTLTPHEALETLNAPRSDQNDVYTIALHEVVTARALFTKTGNPSYYVSVLADAENDLKTQEGFKLAAHLRDRGKVPRANPDKPEP